MKKRIFSDKFVDGEIAKIDAMFEGGKNIITLPNKYSENGNIYISEFDMGQLRKYIKQLQDKSYVDGFWYGWSLRDGVKDKE